MIGPGGNWVSLGEKLMLVDLHEIVVGLNGSRAHQIHTVVDLAAAPVVFLGFFENIWTCLFSTSISDNNWFPSTCVWLTKYDK